MLFSVRMDACLQVEIGGGAIWLWDVATGTPLLKKPLKGYQPGGHNDYNMGLAFSPDGKILANGGHDGNVNNGRISLWKIGEGQPQQLTLLNGNYPSVFTVAFSPDGKTLASGDFDKNIRLWDINNGTQTKVIRSTDRITNLVFNPDGRTLANVPDTYGRAYSGYIHLWNVHTGKLQNVLTGHLDSILRLAFSSDGSRLISMGSRKTILQWQSVPVRLQKKYENIVRLIYFVPRDINPDPVREIEFKGLISGAQQFYADAMQKHGFGKKTFDFEKDVNGKAIVHRIYGREIEEFYKPDDNDDNTPWDFDKIYKELFEDSRHIEQFDISNYLYLIFLEGPELGGGSVCGNAAPEWETHGWWLWKEKTAGSGGMSVLPVDTGCWGSYLGTTVHELGHAFGLKHDFPRR